MDTYLYWDIPQEFTNPREVQAVSVTSSNLLHHERNMDNDESQH